jgi:ribosomal protein S18 acetylase RimI-like enzyme
MPSIYHTVRKVTLADAALLARIYVDSRLAAYASFIKPEIQAKMSVEEVTKDIEAWDLMRQPVIAYLAEVENKPAGFITAGSNDDTDIPSHNGEIYRLHILPAYHNRGIGSHLMRLAVDDLHQAGFDGVLVYVYTRNPYIRFYHKLGGRIINNGKFDFYGTKVEFNVIYYKMPEIEAALRRQENK